MPKRYICQSDIFKYINDELHMSQASLCIVIDKVRDGNMVESRISEVKRGRRKGYRGLEDKEDVFFEECFAGKDEELGLQKVHDFVKREELVFPGAEGYKDDNYKSYSLRMLKFGLENCELPSSEKNIVNEDQTQVTVEEETPANNLAVMGNGTVIVNEFQGIVDLKIIKNIKENWAYIFVCCVGLFFIPIIFSIYNCSSMDIFLWMNTLSTPVFFTGILILAISVLIFGLLDAAIAVFIYSKENKGHRKLSYHDIYLIAKYGDTERIIKGGGRYDLGISHICYSVFCNITGAFCSLTIYGFLKTLDGFTDFIRTHNFGIMPDIGLIFVIIVVFAHSFLLFTGEPIKEFKVLEENPDTMRGSRLNVIANNLHMIVNLFFSFIGIILAFIYSFSIYPEKNNMSPLFSLVLISLYLYFWFSSTSPYAVTFDAQCAGSFLLFAPFIAAITSLYTVTCFYSSTYYMLSIGVNVLGVFIWLICLLYKGERSIGSVMRTNKAYFSLYAVLLVLFYLLWVWM